MKLFLSESLSRSAKVLILTALLLGTMELSLHVRAYLAGWPSIFNRVLGESHFIYDTNLALTLLRPNIKFESGGRIISSNALGLRGDLPALPKRKNDVWIVMVGSSSVMGYYANENAQTFPSYLQRALNHADPSKNYFVLNAGMDGNDMNDHIRMLAWLSRKYQWDAVILFPGFNNIKDYCNPEKSAVKKFPLAKMKLPEWVMSIDMLRKNSTGLRGKNSGQSSVVEPDPTAFIGSFRTLLAEAGSLHVPTIVLPSPRSFLRTQSEQEQIRRAETARFYFPCFPLARLYDVLDLHNEILRTETLEKGMLYFPVDQVVPTEIENFGDSVHFSSRGNQLAAQSLADFFLLKIKD
ncbi:MAG: SGNH/GDSL hydrolase family protein [Burkholderiaceae bacterium]|nr:MAG: SGNH/GDSL hydrolase family protein [Burkholderiaceae bacterium]